MKLHRLSLALFAALALLTSQWVLATHSYQEDLLHPEPDCQLCEHAIQLDAFAAAPPVLKPFFILLEHSGEKPFYRCHTNQARLYNSRAPPDLV